MFWALSRSGEGGGQNTYRCLPFLEDKKLSHVFQCVGLSFDKPFERSIQFSEHILTYSHQETSKTPGPWRHQIHGVLDEYNLCYTSKTTVEVPASPRPRFSPRVSYYCTSPTRCYRSKLHHTRLRQPHISFMILPLMGECAASPA